MLEYNKIMRFWHSEFFRTQFHEIQLSSVAFSKCTQAFSGSPQFDFLFENFKSLI